MLWKRRLDGSLFCLHWKAIRRKKGEKVRYCKLIRPIHTLGTDIHTVSVRVLTAVHTIVQYVMSLCAVAHCKGIIIDIIWWCDIPFFEQNSDTYAVTPVVSDSRSDYLPLMKIGKQIILDHQW